MSNVPSLAVLPIFSSNHSETQILFDVGSASVGAAVFLLSEGKRPVLAYSVREDLPLFEEADFPRLASSVFAAVREVSKKLIAEMGMSPGGAGEIKCFLSLPWHFSQTKTAKESFEAPKEFTEAILQAIYKKEAEEVVNDKTLSSSGDFEVFEAENMLTKLNGYETSDPAGKKAATVEAELFISVAERGFLNSIRSALSESFPESSVKFHSFSFASFVVVRDFFHEKHFLLMDVSGESTDIAVVRDDFLHEVVPFHSGRNFFLRGLAKKLNVSLDEAFSRFRMAESEMLNEEAHKEVLEHSGDIGREWRGDFQKTFAEMAKSDEFIPHNVFITADNDVAKWFIENIQDEGLMQFMLGDDTFTVRYLNAQFLSAFCDFGKGVSKDPFLMVEGVFESRFLQAKK